MVHLSLTAAVAVEDQILPLLPAAVAVAVVTAVVVLLLQMLELMDVAAEAAAVQEDHQQDKVNPVDLVILF
jgi:hypothetical protein|tara:strand:- start:160 stop:372 length:213 start_codon:yes stop_codon:yes gene_type:complete